MASQRSPASAQPPSSVPLQKMLRPGLQGPLQEGDTSYQPLSKYMGGMEDDQDRHLPLTPKPALGHLLRRPTPFLPQTGEGSGNVLCSGFCHLTECCELGPAQASHPLETPTATLQPPSITRPGTEEEEWGTSSRVPHSQETGPSAFQHMGGTPGRAGRALLSRTFVAATRPVSLRRAAGGSRPCRAGGRRPARCGGRKAVLFCRHPGRAHLEGCPCT